MTLLNSLDRHRAARAYAHALAAAPSGCTDCTYCSTKALGSGFGDLICGTFYNCCPGTSVDALKPELQSSLGTSFSDLFSIHVDLPGLGQIPLYVIAAVVVVIVIILVVVVKKRR